MRWSLSPFLCLSLALPLLACPSSEKADAGGGGSPDAVTPDTGEVDAGILDAAAPDAEPLPCQRDQGGAANRGCDPGEVCNLAMNPPACVPGRACTMDSECDVCSATRNAADCGHGYHVVAFCDSRHGNVCTRGRAPCEPCNDDRDCGRQNPVLPGGNPLCLNYPEGKFCGRDATLGAAACPRGFTPDNGQCRTESCPAEPTICPTGTPGQACAGTDQVCPGTSCGGDDGLCATNNLPGSLGICLNYCTSNNDCPSDKPICNPRGICIQGCSPGSCAGNLKCQLDGFCGPECANNDDCVMRFGNDSYCNTPGQPPPRYFKPYHDTGSCRSLGCERKADCAVPGVVCDKGQSPPACVTGCYEEADCLSGFACKSTGGQPPMNTYTQAQCRALPEKTNMAELGVCCDPGCRNRLLQCQINEYCCGQSGSPYDDPASCGTITSTSAMQAVPGQCFEMPITPWCVPCMQPSDCNSGYTWGYNVDPNINGGQPFQEQEFCSGIAMGLAVCNVTCNPALPDNGCPRGWNCGKVWAACAQDADCNGLTCVGAMFDMMGNLTVPGKCKCGENNQMTVACPTAYGITGTVDRPRCIADGPAGDMFCLAAYNCNPPALRPDPPPGMGDNYPEMCPF